MTAPVDVAAAVIFVWLGMVLAISFLEAPIKFRAPGVTLQIGLGIGRLVFRALNSIEAILAAALIVTIGVASVQPVVMGLAATAVATLAAQLAAVRPRLARRSDAVLAGADGSRSHSHHAYIALEGVKVLALLAAGVALFVVQR